VGYSEGDLYRGQGMEFLIKGRAKKGGGETVAQAEEWGAK